MNIAYSTELICFLILSAVIVSGSLAVVLLENIVYSAFLLGGVFMAVAGLYLLLNASFVAAAQILEELTREKSQENKNLNDIVPNKLTSTD